MKYPYTVGTGGGMLWYTKLHYRNRTCATRFGKTMGKPVPMPNPMCTRYFSRSAGSIQWGGPHVLKFRLGLQNEFIKTKILHGAPTNSPRLSYVPCNFTIASLMVQKASVTIWDWASRILDRFLSAREYILTF